MERLTIRDAEGTYFITPMGNALSAPELRLATVQVLLDRLAAYEDAEEHGLLVILPVKAGDTIYQLRHKKHALGVGVHPRHISRVCVYGNDWIAEHQGDKPCTKNDFGKTWFLTREEAEAALAKGTNVSIKGENNG